MSQQYLFGEMEGAVIRELVRLDMPDEPVVVSDSTERVGGRRAIYRIWPDFEFEALTTRSISTVKADAARNAFGALGEDIVWAVLDSGIDRTHPHFLKHKNFDLPGLVEGEETSLQHQDFTQIDSGPETALQDRYGHGTHVPASSRVNWSSERTSKIRSESNTSKLSRQKSAIATSSARRSPSRYHHPSKLSRVWPPSASCSA